MFKINFVAQKELGGRAGQGQQNLLGRHQRTAVRQRINDEEGTGSLHQTAQSFVLSKIYQRFTEGAAEKLVVLFYIERGTRLQEV